MGSRAHRKAVLVQMRSEGSLLLLTGTDAQRPEGTRLKLEAPGVAAAKGLPLLCVVTFDTVNFTSSARSQVSFGNRTWAFTSGVRLPF